MHVRVTDKTHPLRYDQSRGQARSPVWLRHVCIQMCLYAHWEVGTVAFAFLLVPLPFDTSTLAQNLLWSSFYLRSAHIHVYIAYD